MDDKVWENIHDFYDLFLLFLGVRLSPFETTLLSTFLNLCKVLCGLPTIVILVFRPEVEVFTYLIELNTVSPLIK